MFSGHLPLHIFKKNRAMKKIFVLLILTVCVLFGCSSGNSPKQDLKGWMKSEGRLRVLSTTAMINDLVKEIGGEHVAAISLIVGDMDPHSYELVKGDDEKIKMADLIFSNGSPANSPVICSSSLA